MSLPKEPRQKMINMMYLVLTALLALNVSAEILNAFKTVNDSINTSNGAIDQKNSLTYSAFAKEVTDPQTMANAKIWAPKADKVKQLSATMAGYLESLKTTMKMSSQYEKTADGKEKFNEANIDVPIRMMDAEGHGKKLYDSIAQYKAQILAVLDPNDPEIAGNKLLQADVAKAKADFANSLPISLKVPESESGNKPTGDATKDWVYGNFHMTPTIAAITILNKYENDVKNSEAQLVDYFHKKVGEVKVVFDKFQPIAQGSTSYGMPGDELEITAGVGAFSSAAKPIITINGVGQTLTADGTAVMKTKIEGNPGEHAIDVKITYFKPNGESETISKPVKYTIGVPSGASIFLEKMNVMYVGVENPLTISGGSVGQEKVNVSFTSPGANVSHSGGHYVVKPTTPGLAKIIVNAAGHPYEFPIRVKNLPLPGGFIGIHRGGAISSAEFKAIGGLIARLEDSDFEAPFKVVSYKLAAQGGGIAQYTEASNEGNRWSGSAGAIVGRSTPGTNVFSIRSA